MKYASIAILVMPLAALADWNLNQGVDPLTDEAFSVAISDYQINIHARSAVVRCAGGEFEVYFGSNEFLDNELVGVRYRIDNDELEQGTWIASADGKAVFAKRPEYIAHKLVQGSTFIIEVNDFRGVQYRSTFSLQGSSAAILPVMKACHVDNVPPLTEPSPPDASTSGTGMWAVQLGAFSSQENAERLAADLRQQGYAAFLSSLETGSGTLHRVRVGPQKDRNDSESVAAQLGKTGYSGHVVPHP
jgi:hypothetical protein